MPWTRSSSLHRSLRCVASTVLPVYDEKSQLAHDAADWGSLAHHWAFTGEIQDHRYAELLRKHVDVCGIDRASLWPDDGRIQPTAFAIDCTTGTIETTTEEPFVPWKAAFDDRYFTGEWDYARVVGPVGWVDDLKTGRPPEPDDEQIGSYCLALWLDHDKGLNVVQRSVTHWPRPNLYAKNPRAFHPPKRFWGPDMAAFELDEFLLSLKAGRACHVALKETESPEDYANPGEHCLFCPARMFCPRGNDA